MKAESFRFSSPSGDGVRLFTYLWEPVLAAGSRPAGVVQIAHGMVERASRYERFAERLTAQGYVVAANDHRGHGRTAGSPEHVGHLADADGFERMVGDCRRLTEILRERFPGLPVYLFGHSMGSFVSQRYIQRYGRDLRGVILCGSAGKSLLVGIGRRMAARELRKNGPLARSAKMDRLAFGAYNRSFRPNRTPFDWLSRDDAEVDRYIADPYCGVICTCKFYDDLLSGLAGLFRPSDLQAVPRDLPIYLIAGDMDPVGARGKGVQKLYRMYERLGVRDVQIQLYPGARHEILNETNRDEVMSDVLDWLRAHG